MPIKIFSVVFLLAFSFVGSSQNLHHFFIKDTYQRSYFNPALNNEGFVSIATGLGVDLSTSGPSVDELTDKRDGGGLLLNLAESISSMEDNNDIFGNSAVNTLDISVETPFVRISAGHAWKATGWLNYTKNLAQFVTEGNAAFIGETLVLAPQIEYINYNEIYLGLQRKFGPVSIGAKIKRLSGVESIYTEKSKIDLFTSDEIYQLTVENDFELNASNAFNYTDISDFSIDIENYSFDNFMVDNSGWAFDLGASVEFGELIEISLGIVDVGSMEWDKDVVNYSSETTKTIDGIDLADYLVNDTEIVLDDSLDAILNLDETNNSFQTSLPTQVYLGGTISLNDKWSFGALFHTIGNGDRRSNAFAVNSTLQVNSYLSLGLLYSAKDGNLANIGLHGKLKVGPAIGFISTDNLVGAITPAKSKESNIRAGLSIRL